MMFFICVRKLIQIYLLIFFNNTNQSGAIRSSTTKIDEYRSSLASSAFPTCMKIKLDPIFKIHSNHLFSVKRIVGLYVKKLLVVF